MKHLLFFSVAQFLILFCCFSQDGNDAFFEKIGDSYDRKVIDTSGLNFKLAENDDLFFNHNGIVMSGESFEKYAEAIQSEEDLINLLHNLEKNTVQLGAQFLKIPSQNARVLDAGCGAGGCALMIHNAFACFIEGITLSSEQAKFANAAAEKFGCGNQVHFYRGNMLHIDRGDNFYDCIWGCESTEHIPVLTEMFQEFGRVSKPQARLVLIAWCANDPDVKKQVDDHYITQIHTVDEYLQIAEKVNWKLLDKIDLAEQTAVYWKLRTLSKKATGAEKFMEPGFSSRNLQYFLLVFENGK